MTALRESVIHVIRHGRTVLNAQGRFRGRHDVPLDQQGHVEAERIASALAARPISLIVASPLLRARETAEPIAKITGLQVDIDADLIDLDHGSWEALTADEAAADDAAAYERWRSDPRSSQPPGGEPVARVEERIFRAVDRWSAVRSGTEVALVTHEIPIRLLVSRIRGIDGSGVWEIPLATGSVTRLRGLAGSWYLDASP